MPSSPTPDLKPGHRMVGRRAFVTGAGGGIGGAIAKRFALEGAKVALVDVDVAAAAQTAERIASVGGDTIAIGCDVGSEGAVQAAIVEAVAAMDGLDTVVNCAAAREPTADITGLTLEQWENTLRINLTGAFLVCREAIPHFRADGGGSIVNIASQFGSVATTGRPAYHATKAALINFTRALAVDFAADRIRANTVSPGAIETPRLLFRHDTMEAVREKYIPKHPIGRLGLPEDIANAVLYVASDEASFMTGSDLVVDGGFTAV